MFDYSKLSAVIAGYKEYFPKHWKDESYKWKAIAYFQKYWDINAKDFRKMFMQATDKTYNLLANMNNYPKGMMNEFAKAEPETVRGMFMDLFDESRSLSERIDRFQMSADTLRDKYDDGSWKNHYQNHNAITTYLWLKYPDKYYIYKYSEVRAVARELECDFIPKKGTAYANIERSIAFYDEIRSVLKQDPELQTMMAEKMSDTIYPDPEMVTLTVDLGFYVSRFYGKIKTDAESGRMHSDNDPEPSADRRTILLNAGISAPNASEDRNYWWLNANPKIFSFSNLKIGEEVEWSLYNDNGNKRRIFKNFEAAKEGDIVVGYESNPVKQIVALARVSRANDGAHIYFEKLEGLSSPIDYQTLKVCHELDHMEYFVNPQGSFFKLTHAEYEFLMDMIREENPVLQQRDVSNAYDKEKFLEEVYMTGERYDTLVGLLRNKKNLILQGAPGVGKTFAAKRLAYSMMGEADDSRIEFIQFHQNYSYEDFIMGYKPNDDGFKLTNGVFYRFCMAAANHPYQDYFFIIDEINRGNMSKIFGELLMLIEKDYRGTKATLAYSGTAFSVPDNLYIIGMMNTADRSLAMIDYALRRRFSFFSMEPGFASDGFKKYQAEMNNETFNALIEQITELNREIMKDDSLGEGFRIGHSYFCGRSAETCTDEWMKAVVFYDIIPMLQEYWFDDKKAVQKWENALIGVFND